MQLARNFRFEFRLGRKIWPRPQCVSTRIGYVSESLEKNKSYPTISVEILNGRSPRHSWTQQANASSAESVHETERVSERSEGIRGRSHRAAGMRWSRCTFEHASGRARQKHYPLQFSRRLPAV